MLSSGTIEEVNDFRGERPSIPEDAAIEPVRIGGSRDHEPADRGLSTQRQGRKRRLNSKFPAIGRPKSKRPTASAAGHVFRDSDGSGGVDRGEEGLDLVTEVQERGAQRSGCVQHRLASDVWWRQRHSAGRWYGTVRSCRARLPHVSGDLAGRRGLLRHRRVDGGWRHCSLPR